MKKQAFTLRSLFAGPAMAALCVAPVMAQEEPELLFGFHDSFVQACNYEETRQVIYPLTLEYSYQSDMAEVAGRIPTKMEAEVSRRLGDLINYAPVLSMVEFDSVSTVLNDDVMRNYKRGLADLVNGHIEMFNGGSAVFVTGCEKTPITNEFYSANLSIQNDVREMLIERRDAEYRELERSLKERTQSLAPKA